MWWAQPWTTLWKYRPLVLYTDTLSPTNTVYPSVNGRSEPPPGPSRLHPTHRTRCAARGSPWLGSCGTVPRGCWTWSENSLAHGVPISSDAWTPWEGPVPSVTYQPTRKVEHLMMRLLLDVQLWFVVVVVFVVDRGKHPGASWRVPIQWALLNYWAGWLPFPGVHNMVIYLLNAAWLVVH